MRIAVFGNLFKRGPNFWKVPLGIRGLKLGDGG